MAGDLSEKKLIERGWFKLFKFDKFTVWRITENVVKPWTGLYVVSDRNVGDYRKDFWVAHDGKGFSENQDRAWLGFNAPSLMAHLDNFMKREFDHVEA